ncbi:hypothetical protein OAC89_03070 [Deltaproteobacteria bacterium]|nr:hypothetical protein [Deltaproteobacteria bacterium]
MSIEVISILISLLACVIALLSAYYARKSREIAQEANNISVHQNLRPLRLAVYKLMKEYAHYCSTYRTFQCMKAVEGTRDLVEHIQSLKWEIDNYGPLNMPDIETKATEFQNKGWQLQRVLDRLAGHENKPHDAEFEALEDDMHGIIDWFATEHKGLKGLFTKYLGNA